MLFRCFVYKKSHSMGRVTYEIAQSADATCNGLTSMQNIIEGSKTMRLTSGKITQFSKILHIIIYILFVFVLINDYFK